MRWTSIPSKPGASTARWRARSDTRQSPRFDVRRIDYPVGTFLPVEQVKSVLSSDYKDRRAEIRDIARNITAAQRCDLCIVVTKSSSMYSNTNQAMSGLGILANSNLLFENVFLLPFGKCACSTARRSRCWRTSVQRAKGPPLLAGFAGRIASSTRLGFRAPRQVAQSARLRNATSRARRAKPRSSGHRAVYHPVTGSGHRASNSRVTSRRARTPATRRR